MSRFLLILSILTLHYLDGFAQTEDLNFDRMIIAYKGDSLIKQEYELVIKTNKVYFITPFASYLHIEGGEYKTRIRLDKIKRIKIFRLVDVLIWKNIEQATSQINRDRYYIIKTFSNGKLIRDYKISEELLPADFNTLYQVLSNRK